jgi:DNA-binding MarR family transcriptional regulator
VTDYPTNGLDEIVHQRHRLGILTIIAEARRAEFGYLREALELTPGNLSRHLTVLEEAGLVDVEKGYEGRRPRTWVSITRQGRSALVAELDVLSALVHQHALVARRAAAAREAEEARKPEQRKQALQSDSAQHTDPTEQPDAMPGNGELRPPSEDA